MRARCCRPDRPSLGLTTYDAKDPDTAYPPIEPLLPPDGALNVLIILLDDVGFGASSTFGGPCRTPTADRLASTGLRYNRFHTSALCAPSRQALLTGRNHHSVGIGSITETATSAPGNSSLRPNTKAPLAMTLKLNGYSTAQFGKCHEVPVWQSSPLGPFDAWPRVAVGSRRSTASSVARTTNGIRRCMTVRRPWSRPGLQKRADDLLRRRNHGHRLRVRYHGHLGLQRATAGSQARSTGCSSIWARMITTTSSTPRNGSGSPCRGSSEIAAFQRRPVLVCELAHGFQLLEHQLQIRGSQSRQQLLAFHSQRPVELPGLGLALLGHLNQPCRRSVAFRTRSTSPFATSRSISVVVAAGRRPVALLSCPAVLGPSASQSRHRTSDGPNPRRRPTVSSKPGCCADSAARLVPMPRLDLDGFVPWC